MWAAIRRFGLAGVVLATASGATMGQALAEADVGAPGREFRYQIVKATEDTVWRMDRQTGEIVACRFDGGTMACGSNAEAVMRGKTSYDDLKRERRRDAAEDRELKRAERDDVLAFFLQAMRSMMSLAREYELDKPRTTVQ